LTPPCAVVSRLLCCLSGFAAAAATLCIAVLWYLLHVGIGHGHVDHITGHLMTIWLASPSQLSKHAPPLHLHLQHGRSMVHAAPWIVFSLSCSTDESRNPALKVMVFVLVPGQRQAGPASDDGDDEEPCAGPARPVVSCAGT